MEFQGQISAQDLLKLKPDVLESLKEAVVFNIILEPIQGEQGNFVKLVPVIHDKWTDGLNLGAIQDTPGLEQYLNDAQTQEQSMQGEATNIISKLVKMADRYDQEGNYELAEEVDRTIQSLAGVRAPLKHLDDDVKKNLIIFVHDADQNNTKSIEGLKELLRRLRYFDFDDFKDLGLDKVIKEMEKTQCGLGDAKKRFYEITHGKKPSKKDLEDILKDVEEAMSESKEQKALDFFDAHSDKDGVVGVELEPVEDEEPCVECDEEEGLDEELEIFLIGLEDEPEDEKDDDDA